MNIINPVGVNFDRSIQRTTGTREVHTRDWTKGVFHLGWGSIGASASVEKESIHMINQTKVPGIACVNAILGVHSNSILIDFPKFSVEGAAAS